MNKQSDCQPWLFPEAKPVPRRHKHALDTSDHEGILRWDRLLISKAKRFKRRQREDYEDAIQEARLAAVIAVGTHRPAQSQLQTHIGSAADCRLKTFGERLRSRGFTHVDNAEPATSSIESAAQIIGTIIDWSGVSVEQGKKVLQDLPEKEYHALVHGHIRQQPLETVALYLNVTVADVRELIESALGRIERLFQD